MVAVVCSQCNWHAKDKTPLPNSCPISCAALCSMTCRIMRRRNPKQLEAFRNTLSLFESSQSYQHLKQLAKSSTVHFFFFFYPFWAFPVHSCTRHSVPQFKCISAIDFMYYFIFLRDAMDKLPSLKIQGLWECLPGYSGKEKPNWQDKRINISTIIVEKKGYMGWLLRAGGPNG